MIDSILFVGLFAWDLLIVAFGGQSVEPRFTPRRWGDLDKPRRQRLKKIRIANLKKMAAVYERMSRSKK